MLIYVEFNENFKQSTKYIHKVKKILINKKIVQKTKLFFILIIIGFFANFIFINFFEEEPIELRTIENACGEYPINFAKPDISSNPNYVFVNDSAYENRVLWDELSNLVIVNSFIECEHYFTGGWNYFSQEYYLANQESSCLKQDKLKDQDLNNVKVYLKNIGLREFMLNKNSLCIGSIQNKFIDGDVVYFEVLYSRAAYILISQIFPLLLLVFFNLRWFRFVLILIISQILSQFLFHYYFGLNVINSVSLFSLLALMIIKLENENETKI